MDKCGFQIITDSTCDLPKSWVAAHPYVTVVDVPVILTRGSESHILRDLGPDDFNAAEDYVEQGFRASTSHPMIYSTNTGSQHPRSMDSIEDIARENAENGKDVIYVVMNSALSGAYGNATPLFRQLQEEYKGSGRRLICVDSQCMSTGLALLLLDIAEGIEKGTLQDVDQIASFVEEQRGHIGHFFTWGELSYIKNSGRVSSVQAMIGNILGLRLLCSAQYCSDGQRRLEHITPSRIGMVKLRGIGKWAEAVATIAEKNIVDPTGTIIIAHGNVPRDAHIIYTRMVKHLPNAKYMIGDAWRCGSGIQAHGGPTSIHVNFHTKNIGLLEETIKEAEEIVRNLNR